MIYVIGFFVAGSLFLFWQLRGAKEGYEDNDGFHYGRQK